MKKPIKLILSLVGIVVFFAAASFLYNDLSGKYAPQNIVVNDDKAEVETESDPAESGTPENETEGESSAETVSPAPDFTVYDLEGNAVKLSDHIGKPVVINFWASWCPPCKGEMPDFEETYRIYGEDVQFMMVNLTDGQQETVSTGSAFIAEHGYTFPVFYDTDLDAAVRYQVYSVPATYFIDRSGIAVARASGAIDAETLAYGISMITE